MPARVLEYLGQQVLDSGPVLRPAQPGALCPFSGNPCSKVNRSEPLKPVCTVSTRGKSWIVCKDRLCATSGAQFNLYQKDMLLGIAKEVAQREVSEDDVIYKREAPVAVPNASNYHADYVMVIFPGKKNALKLVVEMQGGGETSSTGGITNIVQEWEDAGPERTNSMLTKIAPKTNAIETNAWRRQQEQFMVKGRVAVRSGGKLVFCIGELIFDYLQSKFAAHPPEDLRKGNWTLCLIAIKSTPVVGAPSSSLDVGIDRARTIFTDYDSFVRSITSVGGVDQSLFAPPFMRLNGQEWVGEGEA